MMLQSWMGSDFTNDDLVRESSVISDYDHGILGQEDLNGDPAYVLELIPKPEAPVAWGRILEWVRVADYIPLKVEFFNERGERVRTMIYDDIKMLGGRLIPARMVLTEEDEEDRSTALELLEIRFNVDIPESVFSQQNLRRRR